MFQVVQQRVVVQKLAVYNLSFYIAEHSQDAQEKKTILHEKEHSCKCRKVPTIVECHLPNFFLNKHNKLFYTTIYKKKILTKDKEGVCFIASSKISANRATRGITRRPFLS